MVRGLVASAVLGALLALLAGLVGVPVVRLYLAQVCNGEGGRYAVRAAASWYYGSRLIEEGRASEVATDCLPHQGHFLACEAGGLLFSGLAVLGLVHVPSQCLAAAKVRPLDLPGAYRRLVLGQEESSEQRFCRSLLDYQHTSMPTVQAGPREVEAFVLACGAEYRQLGGELRMLLDPLLAEGPIPVRMLQSSDGYSGENCTGKSATQEEPAAEPKMQPEELERLLRASGGAEQLADEGAWRRALGLWGGLDIRTARDLGTDFAGVGQALTRGEIARFNAAPLFSKELFNITHVGLAELEGERAQRVPIYSHLPLSKPRSLAEHGRDPHIGYVNAKRLPHFHQRLPDMPEALGIADTVLHSQNFLWLGLVQGPSSFTLGRPGCRASFHWDPEPNTYVQLAGETRFLLIPQSYTENTTRCGENFISFSCEDAEGLRQLEGVPIILVHLRPGDALVIPSRTQHLVSVQSNDRVALNYFFIPKWRGLEARDGDYYTKAARASLGQLALRQLWIRSVKHVYNVTGKAVYSNAGRLEWF